MTRRIVLLAAALAVAALPSLARACSCFQQDGTQVSLDAPAVEAACADTCGSASAGASSVDGVCDCGDGTSLELNCSDACVENGYSFEPPGNAADSNIHPTFKPQLSVDIPDVSFSEPVAEKGYLSVNFIGEYVAGVYKFLLGFAVLIATVFVMAGGVQYVVGASTGEIGKAKERIRNAVVGLVLLMSIYAILFVVNPQTTVFDSLSLRQIEYVRLDLETSGPEGEPSSCGGISSITELPEPYKTIVANAKAGSACPLTGDDPYDSPTGSPPNCGNHHWYDRGADGNWTAIKNLDYAAPWNAEFKAPFAGKVTYQIRKTADNRCGNTITLAGEAGVKVFICHAKDFVDASGTFVGQGATVTKGQVLGHIGGNCCEGQTVPSGWGANAVTGQCDVSGTMCTDPFVAQSCGCQSVAQAGNTTGPHVHMTWDGAGNILSCLDD